MENENSKILQIKNLHKTFTVKNETFGAVNGVTLSINRGECYGLVGESGCGKSTLSNIICTLLSPDSGEVIFNGKSLFTENHKSSKKIALSSKELKEFHRNCQIIFQDPYSSLNPKMKIKTIIEEPLKIHKLEKDKIARLNLVKQMINYIGLPPDSMEKYPDELSGGQRQRVAIASAMILNPEFVICDESVSALDVLIQAQILNLLKKMQKSLNLTYMFISHNLHVVAYMADRIGVMYKGQIVEEKPTDELIAHPEHPYTIELLKDAGII